MKKLIPSLLLILILIPLFFFVYLGGFSSVSVMEKKGGPFHVVCLDHRGAYSGVGPLFERADKILKERGITPRAMVGIYYDNPDKTAAAKLRSHVGALVSPEDFRKIKENPAPLVPRLLPERSYVTARLPFKNIFSVFLGIHKVYPLLKQYALEHKYPPYVYREKGFENDFIMEIYHPDRIEYYMTTPAKR